jgi:nicotinamide mononucleotide transporter
MQLQDWGHLFLRQVAETDIWQWLAVGFGVAEVLLARANKIGLYPAGIASTVLSIYILLHSGLYAESLLNGYYLVMSAYGWWYWMKKKNKPAVKISYCNKEDWIKVFTIIAGGFALLYVLLTRFTPSNVPVWDSLVSATAWAGMWLLARRKIENWILLNLSNLFAIPLLFYKQLPLYALLTVFLFVVAISGYLDWKKSLKEDRLLSFSNA